MPQIGFRIEDSSPLLSYSEEWAADTLQKDDLLSEYSDASFMSTKVKGESVSFTFYGTEVEVFGAARPDHGRFMAGVDGNLNEYPGGGPEYFWQQLIFKQSNLHLGQHTVRLVNVDDDKFLDIDYVTWRGETGNRKPTKMLTVHPDEEAYYKYSKNEDWATPRLSSVDTYLGGIGRATSVPNATVRLEFEVRIPVHPIVNVQLISARCVCTGDTIALYGPVGPTGTRYGVRLNGGSMIEYTSKRQLYKAQQMLYSNNSLDGSRQKLEVIFLGNPGDELGIDFANIYVHSKAGTITPAMIFGLSFSTAVALISMVTLLLIGLQYCFGWFPFLRFIATRRTQRKAPRWTSPSDEILPYPKDLLPQFSPTRQNRTPTAITFTEISEYPFSTSDYYAQTSFSEARTKSSRMTSSTPRTPGSVRRAQTPGSANTRSNHSHRPYLTAIRETSNVEREGTREKTPSSAIVNSWLLRNAESEASSSAHTESPGGSAG